MACNANVALYVGNGRRLNPESHYEITGCAGRSYKLSDDVLTINGNSYTMRSYTDRYDDDYYYRGIVLLAYQKSNSAYNANLYYDIMILTSGSSGTFPSTGHYVFIPVYEQRDNLPSLTIDGRDYTEKKSLAGMYNSLGNDAPSSSTNYKGKTISGNPSGLDVDISVKSGTSLSGSRSYHVESYLYATGTQIPKGTYTAVSWSRFSGDTYYRYLPVIVEWADRITIPCLNIQIKYKLGDNVNIPAAPEREGYRFVNWCIDAGLTTSFNYEAGVTDGDITLYPKYELDIQQMTKTPISRFDTTSVGGGGAGYGQK